MGQPQIAPLRLFQAIELLGSDELVLAPQLLHVLLLVIVRATVLLRVAKPTDVSKAVRNRGQFACG